MGLVREGWSIEVIATDLSSEAIQRAEAGRYWACEIERGLDVQAMRYFRPVQSKRGGAEWLVDAALRRMVTFRRFNLLDSFGWLDDLDVVFCRNVLMYFDPAIRANVLERIADSMAPDGVLLLGENETAERAGFQSGPASCVYVKSRVADLRAV